MTTTSTPRDPGVRQQAILKLADRLAASCVQEVLADAEAQSLAAQPGKAFTTSSDALEALAVRSEADDRGAA